MPMRWPILDPQKRSEPFQSHPAIFFFMRPVSAWLLALIWRAGINTRRPAGTVIFADS